MKNIDLQIDENYGLQTSPDLHDLVVGDVTLQNQALILQAQKGEWKEKPMVGCGIGDMTNDEDTGSWKRAIREELGRDGLKVSQLKINGEQIEIEADYEKH